MAETMGQIIRRLRRDMDLTQEELAERLNISAPAVSKWENGTSMPDISQIVPLANLFGVSTDVLFGTAGKNDKEEVKKLLSEIFTIYDNTKDGEEAKNGLLLMDKYREAIRLYPNNTTIMNNAAAFGQQLCLMNGPWMNELRRLIGQDGIDGIIQECIRWSELVIRINDHQDHVLSAKDSLMFIYMHLKRWDDARAVADSFPQSVSCTRGIQLANLWYGAGEKKKQKKQHCRNIDELTRQLVHQACMLGNMYRDAGEYEDALYCYTFLRDVVQSMYREEVYRPPFVYDGHTFYQFPAYCLLKLGREEEAVAMLEEAVPFCQAQAEFYNKKTELDIPLLYDCTYSYGYGGTAEYRNVRDLLTRLVMNDWFKPLENNPRYAALCDRIRAL